MIGSMVQCSCNAFSLSTSVGDNQRTNVHAAANKIIKPSYMFVL